MLEELLGTWTHFSMHPIYQTVTRIRFPNTQGHATGFFYNWGGKSYLVTNLHVVSSEDEESTPDSIRIFTRDVDDFASRDYHDISLTGGQGEDWLTHPVYDADIAVLPLEFTLDSVNPRIGIDDERPPETGSLAYNTDSILSEKDRVLAGNKLEIVGYPGHYVDHENDFPVTRNATAASQYGFPYNGDPLFLTDATMHPGTSGSPVLAGPVTLMTHGGIDLWGPAYKLLGIHSATLHQASVQDDQSMLELNTTWYSELIEETLEIHNSDESKDN